MLNYSHHYSIYHLQTINTNNKSADSKMWYYLFFFIASLLFISNECTIDSTKNTISPSIPLLSVSLHNDPHNYLPRLLRSIDHDVNQIIIQVGNEDATVVKTIQQKVLDVMKDLPHLNISIIIKDVNPGCANGFNVGLRTLVGDLDSTSTAPPFLRSLVVANEDVIVEKEACVDTKSGDAVVSTPFESLDDWVLIVNSDIAFYPSTLRQIAISVEQALHNDPLFGIGFTTLCCSSEWSAFVVTRRLIHTIGYFDENIYPAYYEDDDYSIRVVLSGMHGVRFENTHLQHGPFNGSIGHPSGTQMTVRKKSDDTNQLIWRKLFKIAVPQTKAYLTLKWGRTRCLPKDCKKIDGMNGYTINNNQQQQQNEYGQGIIMMNSNKRRNLRGKQRNEICDMLPVPFQHPFNDEKNPLWYWQQWDQDKRNALLHEARKI